MRLSEGVELRVDASSFDDVRRAWHAAVAGSHMLQIEGSNGKVVAVNPIHVLYLEESAEEGT